MALKIKTEHSYTIKLGHFMPLDSMVQFLNFDFNLFYFFAIRKDISILKVLHNKFTKYISTSGGAVLLVHRKVGR